MAETKKPLPQPSPLSRPSPPPLPSPIQPSSCNDNNSNNNGNNDNTSNMHLATVPAVLTVAAVPAVPAALAPALHATTPVAFLRSDGPVPSPRTRSLFSIFGLTTAAYTPLPDHGAARGLLLDILWGDQPLQQQPSQQQQQQQAAAATAAEERAARIRTIMARHGFEDYHPVGTEPWSDESYSSGCSSDDDSVDRAGKEHRNCEYFSLDKDDEGCDDHEPVE